MAMEIRGRCDDEWGFLCWIRGTPYRKPILEGRDDPSKAWELCDQAHQICWRTWLQTKPTLLIWLSFPLVICVYFFFLVFLGSWNRKFPSLQWVHPTSRKEVGETTCNFCCFVSPIFFFLFLFQFCCWMYSGQRARLIREKKLWLEIKWKKKVYRIYFRKSFARILGENLCSY